MFGVPFIAPFLPTLLPSTMASFVSHSRLPSPAATDMSSNPSFSLDLVSSQPLATARMATCPATWLSMLPSTATVTTPSQAKNGGLTVNSRSLVVLNPAADTMTGLRVKEDLCATPFPRSSRPKATTYNKCAPFTPRHGIPLMLSTVATTMAAWSSPTHTCSASTTLQRLPAVRLRQLPRSLSDRPSV